MPPPVNEVQPAGQWTGTYFEFGAWACQLTCSWPQELRAAHGGKPAENVRLFNFGTQAEAAAAVDLLAVWRQSRLGKPLTGKKYNLGLQRYMEHTAALVACKSLQAAREHVRQLKDSGVIATLAADVSAAGAVAAARGAAARASATVGSGGSAELGSKRKRAAAGEGEETEGGGGGEKGAAVGEEQEGGSGSGDREASGSTSGEDASSSTSGKEASSSGSSGVEDEEEPSSAVAMSEDEEGEGEEGEAAAVPAPELAMEAGGGTRGQSNGGRWGHGRGRGGRGGRGCGRGRAAASLSPARGGGGGGGAGFHSVVAAPPAWGCQVHIFHNKLAGRYREEVPSAKGQTNVRVRSFGSAVEAAAAGDLALLWRCQAYGGDVAEQEGRLNFAAAGYRQGPGAAMLGRVLACATGEEVKAVVKQMQDELLFAQLAPALERNPRAAASPHPALAAGGSPGGRGGRGSPGGRARGRGGRGSRGGRSGRGGRGGRGGGAAAAATGAEADAKPLSACGEQEAEQQQQKQQQPVVQHEAGNAGSEDSDLAEGGLKDDSSSRGPAHGTEAVGRRLEVFWPVEQCWYPGLVAGYDATDGLHLISYDDGDMQHLDLAEEQVRWLDGQGGAQAPPAVRGAPPAAAPAPLAARRASLSSGAHVGAAVQPGAPAAARAAAAAAQRAAAPAAAAGPAQHAPPDAAQLLRQLCVQRQSGEEMAVELEVALLHTPGLKERHVAAFLARFATLPDMMRMTHFQLMRYARAGQHNLVCAFVWSFIGH